MPRVRESTPRQSFKAVDRRERRNCGSSSASISRRERRGAPRDVGRRKVGLQVDRAEARLREIDLLEIDHLHLKSSVSAHIGLEIRAVMRNGATQGNRCPIRVRQAFASCADRAKPSQPTHMRSANCHAPERAPVAVRSGSSARSVGRSMHWRTRRTLRQRCARYLACRVGI